MDIPAQIVQRDAEGRQSRNSMVYQHGFWCGKLVNPRSRELRRGDVRSGRAWRGRDMVTAEVGDRPGTPPPLPPPSKRPAWPYSVI